MCDIGLPLLHYVFILANKSLANKLRYNKDIKGESLPHFYITYSIDNTNNQAKLVSG